MLLSNSPFISPRKVVYLEEKQPFHPVMVYFELPPALPHASVARTW